MTSRSEATQQQSSPATERVIRALAGQINPTQADSIRRMSAITRHGCNFINLTVRKDGVETKFEADWLANLLNPRGPS